MIDEAIGVIAGQLNQSLRRVFQLDEDVVVMSNILEQDGSVASHAGNKLAVFLVNIEKEALAFRQPHGSVGSGRSVATRAPICLNLSLMFAANFAAAHYLEALKFISSTITFFQARPVLDHENTPDLDERIEKLVLEIENLDTNSVSNLWGMLSGRYIPSILYKVRMIPIDAGEVTGLVTPITQPQAAISP
jgi:hypothetical protein